MRHHAIIPTNDHQTGHINRRVAAQINLRQGHWVHSVPPARSPVPRYPNAIWGDDEQRLVSDAEVAEIGSPGSSAAVTASRSPPG
jgi:hypothetical protein